VKILNIQKVVGGFVIYPEYCCLVLIENMTYYIQLLKEHPWNKSAGHLGRANEASEKLLLNIT